MVSPSARGESEEVNTNICLRALSDSRRHTTSCNANQFEQYVRVPELSIRDRSAHEFPAASARECSQCAVPVPISAVIVLVIVEASKEFSNSIAHWSRSVHKQCRGLSTSLSHLRCLIRRASDATVPSSTKESAHAHLADYAFIPLEVVRC